MFLKLVDIVRENGVQANKTKHYVIMFHFYKSLNSLMIQFWKCCLLRCPLRWSNFCYRIPWDSQQGSAGPSHQRSQAIHSCWAHFTSQIWVGILYPIKLRSILYPNSCLSQYSLSQIWVYCILYPIAHKASLGMVWMVGLWHWVNPPTLCYHLRNLGSEFWCPTSEGQST